jgi:hypothetical protein
MERDDRRIAKFREIYRAEMLREQSISAVKYFGTTEGPYWEAGRLKTWEAGKSDLDIKVYGHFIIPVRVKIEGVLFIERLNYELGLLLEDVPLEHWTPIYIDYSPCPPPLPPVPRRVIDRWSQDEVGRWFSELIRSHNKEIIERFGPLMTYKHLWSLVRAEQARPIPILCQILL